ncbi:MAG TPA: cell division protein FtsA [Candidatus Margulisiibacteriota bacterium]|nr:cell division protein FtsA [Candidatus Margulisiibacteriota bacterium]
MGKKSELLVGLDVGTSKVAAVVGELSDGSLSVIGVGSAPADGLRKGVVVNIDATVQAIERALKEAEVTAGCEIHTVFAGVGGGHIRGFNSHGVVGVRNREVSEADVERVLEAARAVALPADRDVLHVLPQDFVLDGQDGIRAAVGMSGVRLEARVHIITTAISSAQNVVKCCERTGLHVADLVLEPLAAAEAVLTPEEKELGVALVDLGAGTTDVLVFHQSALKHTAVMSIGGNHVTSDIAAGLRTPFRDAELLKQRSGCALARLVDRQQSVEVPSVGGRTPRLLARHLLTEIIEARAEEILTLARHQIIKCGFDEGLGSGVVLTGGTALLEGMVPLAEQVFETPVRLGTPLNVSGINGTAEAAMSASFAAAVGLLHYGARPRDLMPTSNEDARILGKVRQRLKGWVEAFF